MINFSLFSETIAVEVNIAVLSVSFERSDEKLSVFFGDKSMVFPNSHASDFDIVWRFDSSLADFRLILVNIVVYFSAELWVFI